MLSRAVRFGPPTMARTIPNLVGITNGNNTVDGDSGAPAWRDSGFGPLAQGTHVGVLIGLPQMAIEMR